MCVFLCLFACVSLHLLPPHKLPWEATVEKSLFREQKSALINIKIKQLLENICTNETFFGGGYAFMLTAYLRHVRF